MNTEEEWRETRERVPGKERGGGLRRTELADDAQLRSSWSFCTIILQPEGSGAKCHVSLGEPRRQKVDPEMPE